eukprot:300530-Rhodomonas_salina.1
MLPRRQQCSPSLSEPVWLPWCCLPASPKQSSRRQIEPASWSSGPVSSSGRRARSRPPQTSPRQSSCTRRSSPS